MPRTIPSLFPPSTRQLASLGERLRRARLRRRYSAESVAKRAGVARATLYRVEEGIRCLADHSAPLSGGARSGGGGPDCGVPPGPSLWGGQCRSAPLGYAQPGRASSEDTGSALDLSRQEVVLKYSRFRKTAASGRARQVRHRQHREHNQWFQRFWTIT